MDQSSLQVGARRPILASYLRLLPLPVRLVALACVIAALGVASFVGATSHPKVLPPAGAEAEHRIATVFGRPQDIDAIVKGDYLIERFYVVDRSGNRHVADLYKGRVVEIVRSTRKDLTGSYAILLDRAGIQADREKIAASVKDGLPRLPGEGVEYRGMRVEGGSTGTFLLNFDGSLPKKYSDFRDPFGRDVYTFLADQDYNAVSAGARLINVKGMHYLLSNTALFPSFRDEFGVGDALIMSQVFFLDATSASKP